MFLAEFRRCYIELSIFGVKFPIFVRSPLVSFFCRSRLLTVVSYEIDPYMLRMKFGENYKIIFGERIVTLSRLQGELWIFNGRTSSGFPYWPEFALKDPTSQGHRFTIR